MIKPVLLRIILVKEPNDINDFSVGTYADITDENKNFYNSFTFGITTPKWLINNIKENKICFEKKIFIVNEPNMESNINLVTEEINEILETCCGETWEEVALKINCHLDWEYFDPVHGICDFYKRTRNIQERPYI